MSVCYVVVSYSGLLRLFGVCAWVLFVFFFSSRRRHTRCLSDWSSDVCSSDLQAALRSLLPGLRASNSQADLARALTALTDASLALGDYEAATREAQEAFDLHHQLGQHRSEERRVGKECRSRRWT